MGRYRSRSRSRSYSPRRSKRYDDPRDSRSRRDRRSPASSGLLVRNISLDARPEDLRIPFERFGPLKDVYLPKDYHTGEPRGFGFVKFCYPEDAVDAKEHLNHTVIGGREIRIVFAEENRKTPQEMRRMSRISGRESYKRRSPARSPRRRYHSYSRSPSPARSDLRSGFVPAKRILITLFYLFWHRVPGLIAHLHSLVFCAFLFSVQVFIIDPPPSLLAFMFCLLVSYFSQLVMHFTERERRARDHYYSPRRSRSVSRSMSPCDERNYRSNRKSPRRPRSITRSLSPRDERNYRSDSRSPCPREDDQSPHERGGAMN